MSSTARLALAEPVRVLRVTGLAIVPVDIVVTVDILTLVVTRRRDGGRGTR
jgi:hypothetical protein